MGALDHQEAHKVQQMKYAVLHRGRITLFIGPSWSQLEVTGRAGPMLQRC